MNGVPVVTTRGLTKRYGDVIAVDALDLEVHQGEIYAFLGRNGAGKTTTIRMVLGLIQPHAGEVQVFGQRVRPGRPEWLRRVGSLVETATAYPNLTVRENLEIQRRLTGSPAGAPGWTLSAPVAASSRSRPPRPPRRLRRRAP